MTKPKVVEPKKYLHIRNGDKLLPQKFSFGVYPIKLDVEQRIINAMMEDHIVSKPDEGETEEHMMELHNRDLKAFNKAIVQVRSLKADAEVFKGYFLPILDGEWSEYITGKPTPAREIIQKHLCDEKGKLVYTVKEAELLTEPFKSRCREEIIRESKCYPSVNEEAELIQERLVMSLKKSAVRRLGLKKVQEMMEKKSTSDSPVTTSSSNISESIPEKEASSPE